MKSAPPLVFPSSRVLAGWWRQFAPFAPRSLTVGHLLLHHVEALVSSERAGAHDPFASLVLRALAVVPAQALADLEGRLHLGRQVLVRILGDLAAAGLAEADAGGHWRTTAGEPRRTRHERRTFHFRDGSRSSFVPLERCAAEPVQPPAGWSFDPALLRACVEQSADWKSRHGFPKDVGAVLTPDATDDEPPAWERVVVDRCEHLMLALVVVSADGEEQLRGLAVDPRGWLLGSPRPILSLGAGWREAFPEAAGPPPEAWRGAWRAWCQAHAVSSDEADACALSREGVALRVGAPRELMGRLHSANGEATRDEVWLLAGEGMMRTAARVELMV